jgi:leader peptidase (prepilin peptidase) / N-methyltransferase
MLFRISYVDIRHQIFQNKLVLITLIIGIIFTFIGDNSFYKASIVMMVECGTMFLLELVHNVLGGGDID